MGYEKSRFLTNTRVRVTRGVSSVVNKFRPSNTLITTSVDFVYISHDGHAEENGTEFVCTRW